MMKKIIPNIAYVLAIAAGFFVSSLASAQSYAPYDGTGGYQEIKLDANTYYVAFHGPNVGGTGSVADLWKRRVNEICRTANSRFYVELNYNFEDPRVDGTDMLASEGVAGWLQPVKTGYIPIFIPTASGPSSINGPTKQAPVRCYATKPDLKDPKRLQEIG
jgi:hypothetical protein